MTSPDSLPSEWNDSTTAPAFLAPLDRYGPKAAKWVEVWGGVTAGLQYTRDTVAKVLLSVEHSFRIRRGPSRRSDTC